MFIWYLCKGELTCEYDERYVFALFRIQVGEDRSCHISAVIILSRSDKQPDRVEISPEQLSAASTEAEISFLLQL